ncbi:hypothetical protein SO802_005194 [Lithocarpus litseifolius]|uniref:RNase H type-1 domain-containing protein n=1 Tax=Lithocarpus litseifolius TaxID=425828 RepID=A0AAW2DN46_9ROSI
MWSHLQGQNQNQHQEQNVDHENMNHDTQLLSTINSLGILPTRFNLAKRNIIADNGCPICVQCPETEVHVPWDCPAAQDVWAGSRTKLQKCPLGQQDMVQLLAYLMDRLEPEEVELFLVQAWIIWNQRNSVLHGGKLKDPGWLNKRAEVWMEEIAQAQQHLSITCTERHEGNVWRPPPPPFFKLNFDAAIIKERSMSRFGAVIRNEHGEVMAALSAMGPSVSCSEDAETMACRKAVEFAVDAGFSELMIEGKSVNVMKAISSSILDLSVVGNVVADIQWIIRGLRRVSFNWVKRDCNRVAHVLAIYARNLNEDMYWMEDAPPVALEAMYGFYICGAYLLLC